MRLEASDLGPRTSDLGPRTSDLGPRTSDFGLRTSDFGLRTSDFGLRTSDFGLRTSDFGLRTSDFGLRTSDFGLRTSSYTRQLINLRSQAMDCAKVSDYRRMLPGVVFRRADLSANRRPAGRHRRRTLPRRLLPAREDLLSSRWRFAGRSAAARGRSDRPGVLGPGRGSGRAPKPTQRTQLCRLPSQNDGRRLRRLFRADRRAAGDLFWSQRRGACRAFSAVKNEERPEATGYRQRQATANLRGPFSAARLRSAKPPSSPLTMAGTNQDRRRTQR